jgi:hypothetical protein
MEDETTTLTDDEILPVGNEETTPAPDDADGDDTDSTDGDADDSDSTDTDAGDSDSDDA